MPTTTFINRRLQPTSPHAEPLRAPRLLLVTGVPPGSGCVGEIILRDLCHSYPRRRVCCYAVTGQKFVGNPDPELSWVPVRNAARRYERPRRRFSGRLGSLIAMLDSRWNLERYVRRLVNDAVSFGEQHRVEKVWMVLDAVTTIAMGPQIAERLDVPLLSLVWDAPDYLMRQAGMDHFSRRRLMNRFGRTLLASERVAVVSETMAEDYSRQYGADCVILRHGLASGERPAAKPGSSHDGRLVIGFAGGLYAHGAWKSLMAALAASNWRVAGREVVLRVLGSGFDFRATSGVNIEYLGWRCTTETAEILAECDVNYLPQPFEPSLADLARYSFPTKLSTYAAAGRPVFVHAPESASLSRFFQDHAIGACCQSLDAAAVLAELGELVSDSERYAIASGEVVRLAETELNAALFRRRFAEFVGISPGSLVEAAR